MLMVAVGLAAAMPVTAMAEGHTSEFPGNKGYVGDKGTLNDAGYLPPQTQRAKKAVRVVSVPPCPPDFTGLYRGTLYCLNGKLVP
ncbi:MAG: hypothetical protein HKN30_01380 [Sulfitobacter sp.]|nr:hypothetical protein [Sulfitobacter sp.]